MSDNPSSPLLGSTERPGSIHSHHTDESHEDTPLLSQTDSSPRYDGEEQANGRISPAAAASPRSIQNGGAPTSKEGRRWPTVVAVSVLGLLFIAIILGAFFTPAAVQEYVTQALVIEPTNLSIANFTSSGVTARVQANFRMDASRVKNIHIRNVGRFGTWLAQEVESEESRVEVYLPEYGNILIGTAMVPTVFVNIRNGHTTAIDFLTDLEPGNIEGIRMVANEWLEGRMDKIRLLGKTNVSLKSGLISLGSQSISESLVFEGNELPEMPKYNITKLNFQEVPLDTGRRGMSADVSVSLVNSYPVTLDIPPLAFDILVSGCHKNDEYIPLADAVTGVIHVAPKSDIGVEVGGLVRELPKRLLQTCTNIKSSPLDILLGNYIHGNETTVYVRGSRSHNRETPEWISSIISSITVPVQLPGKTLDGLMKNFSLTDTKFKMPSPFAEPGSRGSKPEISGTIVITAAIPENMNFSLNVTGVRATANIYYKETRFLGVLNLTKWQEAESERLEGQPGEAAALRIKAQIKNAPIDIKDNDVFTDVLSDLFFGGSEVELRVDALVDVLVGTVLGDLTIKGMPAGGKIPVKPVSLGEGGISSLHPQIGDLQVLSTSKTALNLQARVNFTNPTEYSAEVPYVNIHILNNGSVVGCATVQNVSVHPGNNSNLLVQVTWDPSTLGGKNATKVAREFLSQYISGYNTTMLFRTHKDSIPHQPGLGLALSKFAIELPTPRLFTPAPGDSPDDSDPSSPSHKPHFIDDATFHLFSSTATFTLISPLKYSTLYIDSINATALYNHTEPVGKILYELPFKVPPGRSMSPRLPVDWSFDSVGYAKLREALGGGLKLDARGTVDVRLDQWTQNVWYEGSGIGAQVRF